MIRLTIDAVGAPTIVVSGVLDSDTVVSVCRAVAETDTSQRRCTLDLSDVTSVESDCLGQLARALRDMGVDLDTADPGRDRIEIEEASREVSFNDDRDESATT